MNTLARTDEFNDPILGRVTRDPRLAQWSFNLLLPNGRTIGGAIAPERARGRFGEIALAEIRERVRWVRDNEPAVRDHITAKMFDRWHSDWYDEEIDRVTTRDQFRERIWLARLTVPECRRVTLIYNDAQLFGGRAIVQAIKTPGKFAGTPELLG